MHTTEIHNHTSRQHTTARTPMHDANAKAQEPSGVEGAFRATCEAVLRLLRQNKESLMAVLEVRSHAHTDTDRCRHRHRQYRYT